MMKKRRWLAAVLSLALTVNGLMITDAPKSEAATTGTPVVLSENGEIRANGAPIVITAGSTSNTTTVFVDTNENGTKDSDEEYVVQNEDLSEVTIYGDGNENEIEAESEPYDSVSITMNGGTVGAIYGCGVSTDGVKQKVAGDVDLKISGGKILGNLYGVYHNNRVGGDLNIDITGGEIGGTATPIDAKKLGDSSTDGKATVAGMLNMSVKNATFTGKVILAGEGTIGGANILAEKVNLPAGSSIRIIENTKSEGNISIDVKNVDLSNVTWDLETNQRMSLQGQFSLYVDKNCTINTNSLSPLQEWAKSFRAKEGGGVLIDFYASVNAVVVTVEGHVVYAYGNCTLERDLTADLMVSMTEETNIIIPENITFDIKPSSNGYVQKLFPSALCSDVTIYNFGTLKVSNMSSGFDAIVCGPGTVTSTQVPSAQKYASITYNQTEGTVVTAVNSIARSCTYKNEYYMFGVPGTTWSFSVAADEGRIVDTITANGAEDKISKSDNGLYSVTLVSGANVFAITFRDKPIELNKTEKTISCIWNQTNGNIYDFSDILVSGDEEIIGASVQYAVKEGSSLPAGLTLTNGVIAGTPEQPTPGRDTTIVVTGKNGTTAELTLTFIITGGYSSMNVNIENNSIVYGTPLSAVEFESEKIEFVAEDTTTKVPGTIQWVDPTVVPTELGTYTATWIFIPDDETQYGRATGNKSITVTKIPAKAPEGADNLPAVYGDTLGDVTLPAGYTFQLPVTAKVGDVGANTYKVDYKAQDIYHEDGTDLEVTIQVSQKEITETNLLVSNYVAVYTGEDIVPEWSVQVDGERLSTVDYSITGTNNIEPGTGRATITGKGNYKGSVEKTFIIEKASQTLQGTESYEGETGTTLQMDAKAEVGDGTISYTSSDETVATVDANGGVQCLAEGTVTITATASETNRYKEATMEITITVKASSTPTLDPTPAPTAPPAPTPAPAQPQPQGGTTPAGTTPAGTTTLPIGTVITVKNNRYTVTGTNTVEFKSPVKKTIKSISIPSKVAYSGVAYTVTSIGKSAFNKCKKLTKVTIPSSVTRIQTKAFSGCKKLKSITIKASKLTAKTIGKAAFKGIHKKAVVKVPKSKLKQYKKILKKKGLPSKAKVKK